MVLKHQEFMVAGMLKNHFKKDELSLQSLEITMI